MTGEGPLHNSQQQAQAMIGGELHPRGPQPGFARGKPTKTSRRARASNGCGVHASKPAPSLAREQPHKHQQQAMATIGGELHPQGPPPQWATDHPTKASSRPGPRKAGAAPTGTSARIGEGLPHNNHQQPQQEMAGLHQQGPLQALMRDHLIKASSRLQPGLAGNFTHEDVSQDWQRTTATEQAAGSVRKRHCHVFPRGLDRG